jgi:hypothetical protein
MPQTFDPAAPVHVIRLPGGGGGGATGTLIALVVTGAESDGSVHTAPVPWSHGPPSHRTNVCPACGVAVSRTVLLAGNVSTHRSPRVLSLFRQSIRAGSDVIRTAPLVAGLAVTM